MQMIGAIVGDIVGSVYEWHNIKTKNFPLFRQDCFFTDDTVMTCAVADALMNYAGWEHGFFWFGGYGVSTEHTAFLNLWNGIPAPLSGSAQQNGLAVAEQIGGQIFIDCWGLMNPGNPERAARFARAAASVTHDGNGIWGGVFIAVCISQAFVETDIRRIIEKGLEYIPQDCEYAAVVRDICAYHEEHPQSWRDCFSHIRKCCL